MGKRNFTKQIDRIIDSFDFERVQEVMIAMGWTWRDEQGSPSISLLKEGARALLRRLVDSRTSYLATGGFVARRQMRALSLSFEIESVEDI